jgi:hypothetical protein
MQSCPPSLETFRSHFISGSKVIERGQRKCETRKCGVDLNVNEDPVSIKLSALVDRFVRRVSLQGVGRLMRTVLSRVIRWELYRG